MVSPVDGVAQVIKCVWTQIKKLILPSVVFQVPIGLTYVCINKHVKSIYLSIYIYIYIYVIMLYNMRDCFSGARLILAWATWLATSSLERHGRGGKLPSVK